MRTNYSNHKKRRRKEGREREEGREEKPLNLTSGKKKNNLWRAPGIHSTEVKDRFGIWHQVRHWRWDNELVLTDTYIPWAHQYPLPHSVNNHPLSLLVQIQNPSCVCFTNHTKQDAEGSRAFIHFSLLAALTVTKLQTEGLSSQAEADRNNENI